MFEEGPCDAGSCDSAADDDDVCCGGKGRAISGEVMWWSLPVRFRWRRYWKRHLVTGVVFQVVLSIDDASDALFWLSLAMTLDDAPETEKVERCGEFINLSGGETYYSAQATKIPDSNARDEVRLDSRTVK